MSKSININQKIAIIGCGYWGTILVNSLINIGFKNIFAHDKNLTNVKILKKKFKNIRFVKKYKELLNNSEIKIFFFATPPSKSYLLVEKAIKRNKNIFVEKPGFKKTSDFKKIIKLNNKFNNILMFGYIYCYHDHINYIKNIIKKNILGKILYIKLQRQNLGPIRNDVNSSFDLASHDLSILFNFFGKMPNLINHIQYPILKKGISDISNLHLKIGKIYVDVNTSWLNPLKVRTLTIIGKKKMLQFDELNLKNPVKIFNKYAKYPNLSKFDKKFLKSKAKIYLGNSKNVKIKVSSPLENELKHFFTSIQKRVKPKTDVQFAYNILKFLDRIN